jgi:hypothetical protein
MTLKEARKLAAHSPYDSWCGHIEKDTQRLAIHCYMNFDEVVAALEKARSCIAYSYSNDIVADDPELLNELEDVLAKAKEVEI